MSLRETLLIGNSHPHAKRFADDLCAIGIRNLLYNEVVDRLALAQVVERWMLSKRQLQCFPITQIRHSVNPRRIFPSVFGELTQRA